jgi:hypothetical protein
MIMHCEVVVFLLIFQGLDLRINEVLAVLA